MSTSEPVGTFEEVLGFARPEDREICKSLRRLIASLDPLLVQVAWPRHKIVSFGVGPRKNTQHYAYIGVQKSHINLGFYHGTSLPDPTRLLEGTGKSLRHVKLRDVSAVADPALAALLRLAVAERAPYRA